MDVKITSEFNKKKLHDRDNDKKSETNQLKRLKVNEVGHQQIKKFSSQKLVHTSSFKLPLINGICSANQDGTLVFGTDESLYIYDLKSIKETTPIQGLEQYSLLNALSINPKTLVTITLDNLLTIWKLKSHLVNNTKTVKSLLSIIELTADTEDMEKVPGCSWMLCGHSSLQLINTLECQATALTFEPITWVHHQEAIGLIGIDQKGRNVFSYVECSKKCKSMHAVKETASKVCAATFDSNFNVIVAVKSEDKDHLNISSYKIELIDEACIEVNFPIEYLQASNLCFGNIFVYNTKGNIANVNVDKLAVIWSINLFEGHLTPCHLKKIQLSTHLDTTLLIADGDSGYLSFFDADNGLFIKKLKLDNSNKCFIFEENQETKIVSLYKTPNESSLITYTSEATKDSSSRVDLSITLTKPNLEALFSESPKDPNPPPPTPRKNRVTKRN